MSPRGSDNKSPRAVGKVWWLPVGLAPIPIGLLMGPGNIFTTFGTGTKNLLVGFVVLTSILGVAAGIGLSGPKNKRMVLRVALGLFLAVWIVSFDLSVVFFVGCCSAFSKM